MMTWKCGDLLAQCHIILYHNNNFIIAAKEIGTVKLQNLLKVAALNYI